jgi:Heparinase II/III-like protein/Heparinase II/III N-terminus
MNWQWYLRRVRAMSFPEIAYRLEQTLRRHGRALAQARPATTTPRPAWSSPGVIPPLRIRFFDVDLPYPTPEAPLDWARDYKNGKSAPTLFYGAIDYRDEAQVGDSKYTWELNRHQFLAPWALAYHEEGGEPRAEAVVFLMLDWIHQNPRYVGINWTSSLELALRILSWGIALDLCAGSPAVGRARATIAASVAEQARYIRETLSLHSSANNHLVGELVGLLASGAFFPEARGTKAHAEFARARLLEESERQNLGDGVNREQAIYYHHYTCEYLLTTIALFARLGWEIPPPFRERVRRMVSFADSMVDDRGQAFEIGDADDGSVTGLLSGTEVGVYESLLWSGYRLFADEGFGAHAAAIARTRGGAQAPDLKSRYLFPGEAPPPSRDGASRVRRRTFKEGGYFVSEDEDFTLCFKASPFGYPSIAAHAHCDQLSVGLKRRGATVLTDAGTYVYHTEDRWRRFFRGTSAHNTVGVDGRDQAEYAGPFLWSTHADASLEVVLDEPGLFETRGRHFGYRRLPDPVDHERMVSYRQGLGYSVIDRLEGHAPHVFELYWNFGHEMRLEALPWSALAPGWRAFGVRHESDPPLVFLVQADGPFELRRLRGDEAVPAGFESRQYLRKHPCDHLRARVAGTRARFSTLLLTHCSLDEEDVLAATRGWN